MPNEITRARALARIAHRGQKYGDGDYFDEHIFKVATRVLNDCDATDAHMATAYLHDIIEDSATTIEDLTSLGFSPEVIEAVDMLTRKPGQTYNDYVRSIAANPESIAWLIKHHDLHENLANSIKTGDARRISRYENALGEIS